MRTARSSGHPVGVSTRHPPPRKQTPQSRHSPEQAHPPVQAPPRDQTPPVNRMTDACENITLLQLRCGR